MNYHFGVSGNSKTGKMFVTTSDAATCPDTCSFKVKGCYAKYGPLKLHWDKVSSGERNKSFEGMITAIGSLKDGEVWRMNQAGDLPGVNTDIDCKALSAIVDANKGKRGFTYTHKPMNSKNAVAVKQANDNGFTINLSADNLNHADELAALNIAPVAVVVPRDTDVVSYTPAGNKVVICPAQTKDLHCVECALCAKADRTFMIGFRSHGTGAKTVDIIARG